MDLLNYISDMDRRRALARALGTDPNYLWQIATGWRGKRAGRLMARAIERETAGTVTVADLRPDLAAAMEAAGSPSRSQPPTAEAA